MEDLLHPGRRIWVTTGGQPGLPSFTYSTVITKFRQFLPAGAYQGSDGHMIERNRSLVQLYTDPGGMRTLSVGEITLHDPGRRR